MILPRVNSQLMNLFLAELSKEMGDRKLILVMDCAGWHRSKNLNIPANIEILYLPPYSPELNPVEKLWQYIKAHTIKNKIYQNLETLEKAVCDFISTLTSETVLRTCSLNHCIS